MTAIVLLPATLAQACSEQEQTGSRKSVMDRLALASEKGTFLFGHQDSYFYGKHWVRGEADKGSPWKSDINDVCGDFPAVLGCDLGGIEVGDDKNLDGVPFDMMREAIIAHHENGGIISLSWHHRNPLTGGTSWDNTKDSVVRSILPGHSLNADYLKWLDKLTLFLESLKGKNGEMIPVIFRPYHEHTGDWFWWGRQDSTPDEYISLWRMAHDYLTSKGLTNLIWSYSPNLGVDEKGYLLNYPGDKYVDLLGYDGYQFGEGIQREKFLSSLKKDMAMLSKLGEKHHKLVALTETGYESIPDKNWWTGTLLEGVKGSRICYLLVWRNAHNKDKHYYAPFPGEPSAENFKEFYNLPETIFLNDFKK